MRGLFISIAAVLSAGCGSYFQFGPDGGVGDASEDAGVTDSGSADAATSLDAGLMVDSGEGDSGSPGDAGDLDGGSPNDAGMPDAGVVEVTTLAGNGTQGVASGTGGPHGTAEFFDPIGVAVDSQRNVYVADYGNDLIREISPAGVVTTIAGDGRPGFVNGRSEVAAFSEPTGVAVTASGNVMIADSGNNRIRWLESSGNVVTFAGNGTGGYLDGPGFRAQFNIPLGIAADSAGNLYVADSGNYRVRKIDTSATVSTLAGNGTSGYSDGPGESAEFGNPVAVAVDAHGNVYVADNGNNRIRKISPAGLVTTVSGNGTAEFPMPRGIAVDYQGVVYVSEGAGCRVAAINTGGAVTTLAGNGTCGFADGAGGQFGPAEFNQSNGLAVDGSGNVYVGDSGNNRVRKISVP